MSLPFLVPAGLYLEEQGLAGSPHRVLGGLELSLQLGAVHSSFTQLGAHLLQSGVKQVVLGSDLLGQQPALLQLAAGLQELRLCLLPLRLEASDLVAAALQLPLGLLQLGLGLLRSALALLEFGGERLLRGAHGGGDLLRDFEQLASRMLQGLHLGSNTEQAHWVSL